ncbi:diguanylate cyclase [Agrobacterium vitis]|uniref:diguanylate cyclase n=2 Tax=Agrobacterium vitis TaxID=373 RepID=A0ABD6GH12_AGRVI|nr:sensor domain-containing diguanylate cyclase [Agrobacterium vitis]MUO79467.1 diguanylate cyclase [Agrobacterium vitis]MUO96010.1 diguanylate cyclase [Agrobacterium vitis]MUP06594.1 diguanylate cyclase [Agrobacterium vitis]MUZ83395.1 diguanylate cyclase [Agrobacterium vitis]MVA12113.1 diguanylate cyclase [Agrobacterium vitis]
MLKKNWMLGWPHMAAQAIRSSLITKIFVICFISIHVPLLAVVAHVLGGGALSEASILLVLLISTLAGTAGCLLSLWRIIHPLRQLNQSITRYRQEGSPVAIAVKTKDEIGTVAQAVSSLVTELDNSLKTLTVQANTDPLTGLANRRFILAKGTEALEETCRSGDPMCLLLFDLDHFKGINDAFGHETGDRALIAAAQTIRNNLRPNDLAGRIGGEEFCVLLPGTNLVQAQAIAERLRTCLEKICLEPLAPGRITASFGLAQSADHFSSFQKFMAATDMALYRAKQHGRNRIHCEPQNALSYL